MAGNRGSHVKWFGGVATACTLLTTFAWRMIWPQDWVCLHGHWSHGNRPGGWLTGCEFRNWMCCGVEEETQWGVSFPAAIQVSRKPWVVLWWVMCCTFVKVAGRRLWLRRLMKCVVRSEVSGKKKFTYCDGGTVQDLHFHGLFPRSSWTAYSIPLYLEFPTPPPNAVL